MTQQQQESTIIHEILEVINNCLALKISHSNLERLEVSLYQVLTENALL